LLTVLVESASSAVYSSYACISPVTPWEQNPAATAFFRHNNRISILLGSGFKTGGF
jgi:hypothetical protein